VKRAITAIVLLSLVISFVSCSPVRFNDNPVAKQSCTPGTPCVNTDGSYTAAQSFTFNQTNKVDILIVNDNSGSMTQEQQNLANSFNGLTNTLDASGMDWQIAVTNTDICTDTSTGLCRNPVIQGATWLQGARGQFMGPLGSSPAYGNYIMHYNDPNVATTFGQTIQRQNQLGSGDERAIYAASLALFSGIAGNNGFVRDNSNLALIILSDEDERSVGGNCITDSTNPLFEFAFSNDPSASNYSSKYPCDPSYSALEALDNYQNFFNTFTSTYNGAKKLTVNSIVIKPGDRNCLNQQVAQGPVFTGHYGNILSAFAKATATPNPNNPGQSVDNTYSICDNGSGQFTQDVSNISGAIANLPGSKTLSLNYAPASIQSVEYSSSPGVAVAYTFVPGTNYITLQATPPNSSVVIVSYTYSK
jgi:hypothetical protein